MDARDDAGPNDFSQPTRHGARPPTALGSRGVTDVERGEVLWSPPTHDESQMSRFANTVGRPDWNTLLDWSTSDLDGFWTACNRFTGVRWDTEPVRALGNDGMPGAEWYPDGRLNYAANALLHGRRADTEPALVSRSQTRDESTLDWGTLRSQVARCAAALRARGVEPGDRVAAYLPNIPETVVAFLATASIGAVWSSCAPEFGTRSVIDRFSQIEPKVLFAVDGYRYGGKTIDRRDEVEKIREALPTLRHTIGVGYLDPSDDDWRALLDEFPDADFSHRPVAAHHPLYVLFSSGTTGLPKPIVHGHGGITTEHLKVLSLHHDLGPDDRFCWFTTTGWMMWNYLVSGLLVGATIVLFDGDPAHPDLNTLWDIALETGCTAFGVSAPFIMTCRKEEIAPHRGSLRWVGSTGAPLPADGFRWVQSTLGVPVSSISGGTDICSAFVGSSPLVPVRAGEIPTRLLGCAVEAFDDSGHRLPPGLTGELVVTRPMPSMPVGFWNDHDGSRYRRAYFERFPGVWTHGDWITFTDDGSCVISGRSDATLNRGGVRLGTSDFYSVVEEMPEIVDSLVVHLEGGETGRLVLFVKLAPGKVLDDELRSRVAAGLRRELSPRHVPDLTIAAPDLPRTLSGKKLEIPVKRILGGAEPSSVVSPGAVTNFDALDFFATIDLDAPST